MPHSVPSQAEFDALKAEVEVLKAAGVKAHAHTEYAATGHTHAVTPTPTPTPTPIPPPPPSGGDGYPTYADRAVTVLPGDDIDTKIQSVGVGALIGFGSGVHLIDSTAKQFAFRNGEKVVFEPGAIIRGNWNQTQTGGGLPSPFSYPSSAAYASNVQFLRGTVERFVASPQQAVLNGGNNWRFHKCVVRDNRHIGISLGHGAVAYDCKVYRNGAMGFKCIPSCNAGVVDTCEIYENNFWDWHSAAGALGEAGGMKFIYMDPVNMVVRNSHYHHNHGAGIWYDDVGGGGLIENNLSEYNSDAGIWWEITEGAGTIRNNVSRYNGGEGEIYLSNARGMAGAPLVVEGNKVYSQTGMGRGTNSSIRLLDDPNRGPRLGHIILRNNEIHRGVITGKHNFSVSHYAFASGAVPPGIVISGNKYFTDVANAFHWQSSPQSWAQWQARGYDTAGTKAPYQP